MDHDAIVERMRLELTPGLYDEIRELWKSHSIAEDNRDILGLLATLTDDCVYRLPQTGDTWTGHDGARLFYTELLTAFPDIDFNLEEIVIGPQGVAETARVTATHQDRWLCYPGSGNPIEFRVVIFFPWDIERRLFHGETVFVDDFSALTPSLAGQAPS